MKKYFLETFIDMINNDIDELERKNEEYLDVSPQLQRAKFFKNHKRKKALSENNGVIPELTIFGLGYYKDGVLNHYCPRNKDYCQRMDQFIKEKGYQYFFMGSLRVHPGFMEKDDIRACSVILSNDKVYCVWHTGSAYVNSGLQGSFAIATKNARMNAKGLEIVEFGVKDFFSLKVSEYQFTKCVDLANDYHLCLGALFKYYNEMKAFCIENNLL